ncbi:hypothetical protein [Rhodococcus sp. ACS1]|nr:hypothetical protein [Rhodococcus sp. ACS1]
MGEIYWLAPGPDGWFTIYSVPIHGPRVPLVVFNPKETLSD